MKEIWMVGIGGCIGSMLRYTISLSMYSIVVQTYFPWNTLLVNVVGSFLIGLVVAFDSPGHWHYLLAVGFCGGFTTFSAFSLEVIQMLKNGVYGSALLYITLSILLSILAVGGGLYVKSRL